MKKYAGGISVIIPIYNEELLLEKEITSLLQKMHTIKPCEIVLIENGSKDNTLNIAKKLVRQNKNVRLVKILTPSYGAAVKRGLESARYKTIVQFDLDLIDLRFLRNAVALLRNCDVVVGSKTLNPSSDRRSLDRMLVTRTINYIIRAYFGYLGTDTHGIKAYRKNKVQSLLHYVKNTNLFFDTEVLLLAQKHHLRIRELPVSVAKLRSTRFTMHVVVFQTFIEFITLLVRREYYISKTMPHISTDDYGLNSSVNKATNLLIKNKSVHTVSVLPRGSKRLPMERVKVACHINLIEGKPILNPQLIPTLVNTKGEFYSLPVFYAKLLFNHISWKELKLEMQAQIDTVKKNNNIYEINSHQHTHALYPVDIIASTIARENSISHLRTYGDIVSYSFMGWIKKNILILASAIEHLMYGKMLFQSPIWKKGNVPISFMSWETAYKFLERKVEVVCHPGTPYDKNKLYLSSIEQREINH